LTGAGAIKLIVGLANPGSEYVSTRHNAGGWFVELLAQQAGTSLRIESKFHGLVAKILVDGKPCWLLEPTTYMNESGRSISALMRFYKITPQEVLVAHDELDFEPGIIRLKEGGGHGGHNGLRDTIASLGTKDFYRMRIGIGHPGHKDKVSPYVLGRPSSSDRAKIDQSINDGLRVVDDLVNGELQKACRYLHSV
jgi:PTH1 family peptidyl-tRNA hydrolase